METHTRKNVILPHSWRICVTCSCGVVWGGNIFKPFLVSVVRRLLEMHTCLTSDDIKAAFLHILLLLDQDYI